MKAATLFSGIGAPEVAMPHWQWLWHAEIEKFPSAVMAARHPGSPNLGDVTAHDFIERAEAIGRPDVIVFGSPCQSFSVAGRRLGLDDPRGNLALVALGIVDRLKPRWFVFENVPGLLSASQGSDFGIFLRTVDELGYSACWSVLDAQWFGVAQRRERLFLVGHSGDWRRPAAVLLEPEGLHGHHPPRRQTWQRPAPTIASRPTGGGGLGTDFDCDGGLIVADPISANEARTYSNAGNNPRPRNVVTAFQSNAGRDFTADDNRSPPLRSEGAGGVVGGNQGGDYIATSAVSLLSEVPSALRASQGGGDKAHVMTPIDMRQASRGEKITNNRARGSGGAPGHGIGEPGDPAFTVSERGQAIASSAVRRLTPRECERLQGFPDEYTLVAYRGKPAADGPRYKALGNSMAVPVVRWILNRIETLETLAEAAE